MLRIAVGILTGMLLASAVQGAQVDGVRLWRAPDNTRIVFDLSGPVEYNVFPLPNPSRLVIDISSARLAKDIQDLELDGTPIAKVRYGTQNKNDVRVVLDLKANVQPRSFMLPKHGEKSDRLVIDLFDGQQQTVKKVQALEDLIPDKRDVIIAVDAGHGGEDPGAMGPGRIKEKSVVLEISKRLVEMINAEKGYSAYLVRTGDYYVALSDRRDKARELRADLFVSVHADAFKDPKASGASVFALSRSGATSETARFLARKENEADLIGGVGGVSLTDVDNVLAGVLVDLSMTATLSNSLDVGDRVLREMGKMTKLHKKQVEQAGFAVLKSPDVPSILVETGFISNPQEAKKLSNDSHRKYLAGAIFKGIKSYFYDAPPAGSYIAWSKGGNSGGQSRQYTIARGDTLSDIARRYDVSLKHLLEHNGLHGKAVIKVGQKLNIPAG